MWGTRSYTRSRRSVFPLAGFPVDPHIHGADTQTLTAVNAQQRKVAHGLEKHRNGAEVLEQVKDTRASNTCKALCAAPASMGRGEILVELCQQPFVFSFVTYQLANDESGQAQVMLSSDYFLDF